MEYVRRTPDYIQKWSKENAEVSAKLLELAEADIRLGIYCGTSAEIGMRNPLYSTYFGRTSKLHAIIGFLANNAGPPQALELRLSHEADDIDIIVHDDDFERAVDLLDADVNSETRSFQAADGFMLDYKLHVARKKISSKVIEICTSDGPMVAQKDASTIEYNWSISDYAARNFLNFKTRHGLVPLAQPGETYLIYAIIQRHIMQNERQDIEKLELAAWATLHFSKNISEYCNIREAEITTVQNRSRFRDFDDRVTDFWIAKQHEQNLNRPHGGVWLENWPGI